MTDLTQPSNECFLRVQDLSKSYQEGLLHRNVLAHTSACIRKGEFVAILGKSGSGKSTFLNLLSGIDYPDSGQIIIQGHELTSLDDRQRTLFRRKNIGFIFQFFNLIPTLTVQENVVLPLELNGYDVRTAQAKALQMLEAVQLRERAKTFPENLSGGEQQRVAIARALVHDPILVLADEPTGNLDDVTGRQVLNLLDHLTRQLQRNLILATHSREVTAYADRVLHLREGILVEPSSVTS
jgi:putative ABC transport system ATP-binding protein